MAVTSKKKADLKVVILGTASIGKTTLIHRYLEGTYKESISSTIGASFFLKQWGQYNIAIWDTAGEERFSGLSSFYCRGAGAAILAYDVTDEDSFHSLRSRFLSLLSAAEEDCLLVVVGTKCDLLTSLNRGVSHEDGLKLAKEVNQRRLMEIPYFDTSSLTGQNVQRAFEYIFNTLLPINGPPDKVIKTRSASTVDLENTSKGKPAEEKKACC